jgi:hypothetical protein
MTEKSGETATRDARPWPVEVGRLTEIYKPLPTPTSIRLIQLILTSGMTTNMISFRLIEANLEDPGLKFKALSYAWGEKTSKQYLFSLDGDFAVKVSKNLHLALSDVLHISTEPTLIWADALCINQTDVVERSV